ncbi:hypothetical protein [uncultured Streptomyces sp.]|uniref:hypothetical protein n=1 Tax=uncultured Streptomyces sp. TaxID=174707 RepID=UPI0026376083|nr:hypothetical protein [uncultured Streptomyces sp.]
MNSSDQSHAHEPAAHQERGDIVVSLSDCGPADARAVFDVLSSLFVSDRSAEDVPADGNGPRPTVWTANVDVTEDKGTAGPATLTAPVTVDAQGGYWAVDRLRTRLADAFSVNVVGKAAGDQEQEIRLELRSH